MNNDKYADFKTARGFAHSLNLKSRAAWMKWAQLHDLPSNMPKYPNEVYLNKGWLGWGDFLGTDSIANQNRSFRSFEEARILAHNLKMKNSAEWRMWAKTRDRPENIPSDPQRTYANSGWDGWGDFLGTNNNAPRYSKFRPFQEAKSYVQSLKLQKKSEWIKWARSNQRPRDIPVVPENTYAKEGWNGYGDFLGIEIVATQNRSYRSFDSARTYAKSLNFKKRSEWLDWARSTKKPKDIPACPDSIYRDSGWINWGDFLGNSVMSTKNQVFRRFKDARIFVRTLGIKNREEWYMWARTEHKPNDIPSAPEKIYVNEGWSGWGDFLGTGKIANQNRKFQTFEEAKIYAKNLKFKNQTEWKNWVKSGEKPENIPSTPERAYSKEGWKGYGDFLGTNNIAPKNYKFRPFESAKSYVRSLGFKSKTEWIKWAKSVDRPNDIPRVPEKAYASEGWKDYGDFLGARIIATQNRVFRSFENARLYVRSLNLKNQTAWRKWAKSPERPEDIPAYPDETYEKKGWNGWGDFLGTGVIASQNRVYLPFEQARAYVQSLGFKSRGEWELWRKSQNRPVDIPSLPSKKYINEGWNGWGDFLGTENIAPRNLIFRSFEKAKSYVRSLAFKTKNEWIKWAQSPNKPSDIPRVPERTYADEGWVDYSDFLGVEIAGKNRNYRSYEDARAYVRLLNLKNRGEWQKWARSSDRPNDIPKNPDTTYARIGWLGWGDFLGTGTIATKDYVYRSFEDARNYVRSLGLKNRGDWEIWMKSKDKPKDIPSVPSRTYAEQGWNGWGDWLGIFNNWNINNIRAFVASLLPNLDNFSAAGLYVLFQQTGILDMDGGSKGRSFVQALKTGRFPKEELEKFVNSEASLVDKFLEDSRLSLEDHESDLKDSLQAPESGLSEDEITIQEDLPSVDTKGILSTLDSKLFSTLDKEAIDFFVKEAVSRIWQHAFLNESEAVQQLEQYADEGVYSKEVKRLFLQDYQGAKRLQIPLGYHFPHQPNLMQLYTAYLVKTRKRLGNWSGTGAGKTLSAILASRVVGANLTVICCPNNVTENWSRNILEIYPESDIYIKNTNIKNQTNQLPKYLVLNYEFFQQPRAESKLKSLLAKQQVDFVIIDEIHYSKQRQAEKISLRKGAVSAFLSEASSINDNLHVLGMSATPVINNLFEGKTLIELVTGVYHDELNTKPTISNCISHYQKFVSHGIRWVPQYTYKLDLRTEYIDCSQYIPEIKHQSLYGSMVDLEAILTKAKLPLILDSLRSKTILYTHYIKDILPTLQEAIENNGWKVAVFTGDNKDGLEKFVDGDADILIASSCVGTGVDRLQHVCNRLVVNSLPWTHAEFEQLKGRIYRQGQINDCVDVIIPLTRAEVNGESWSWCDSRWKRIQFKKSISDAAVDGIIPEGHLRTPAQAYKDTMLWLERLERGEVYEIERRKISIPLTDEIKPNVRRRLGDLSQMNSQINRATSSQTHQRFQNHPDEWECYHSVYREDRKNWPVVPYEEAIKWFKARPHLVIGDFGCGEALLASNVENTVFSLDHVAINENVISCDMSHTSLDDACLDAAVFSLSLMGSNFVDYLREAHRCLKLDGHLWIAEPTSRIMDMQLFRDLLFRLGFDVSRIDEKWKFTFIKAIKSERELNQKALESLKIYSILT